MANAAQIVAAFRDVAATKSLSDEEMTDLVKDGILAGLARIYGPTVRAEIDIDEDTGEFDIVVLRRVVEEVEDPALEISLEEARWDDEGFEVGDVMEIPVAFEQFGRNAVMAVKQRIVQRVRGRTSATASGTSSPARSASSCRARSSRSSAARSS
jgi:N utilization substance protein A